MVNQTTGESQSPAAGDAKTPTATEGEPISQRSRHEPSPNPDRVYPNPRLESVKKLKNAVVNDVKRIYREEGKRMRLDLAEKSDVIKNSGWGIATGLLVTMVGIQTIVATAVIVLASVMPWWLATLLAGILLILVGVGIVFSSKAKAKAKTEEQNAAWNRRSEDLDRDDRFPDDISEPRYANDSSRI